MKRREIEKQLKQDINCGSPSDFASVWECCRKQPQTEQQTVLVNATGGEETQSQRKSGRILCVLTAVLLLFCFALSFLFNGKNLFLKNKPSFQQGYFVLDINPSIEVNYDQDGKVTSVVGLNEDGKAVLVGISLEDKSYSEATDILFQRCVSMGYFSPEREDNAVLVSAITQTGEKDETMTSAVKNSFAGAFEENKIRGVVITGVSDPVLQKEAEIYGIDAQKYGLILSYLAMGGELEEDCYSTVSIRELYALIEEQEKELKENKKEESAFILQKFEKELLETLSEQIEVLIETLNVYISAEVDDYEQNKDMKTLEDLVKTLENAKTQRERKAIVNEIMTTLDRLKDVESDTSLSSMIASAKISISVTYDFFEKAFYQLKKVSATPEEISAVRLWKFSNYGTERVEYDFKLWQEEREPIVSAKWYEMKNNWRIDRAQDI